MRRFAVILLLLAPVTASAAMRKISGKYDAFDTSAINQNFQQIEADNLNSVHKSSTETVRGRKYFTNLMGTTTNDNACTGCYGEYKSSAAIVLANFATSTQYSDVASISLTAGDWDVTACLNAYNNGATGTNFFVGISSTSGNSGAGMTQGVELLGSHFASATDATGNASQCIPSLRISLSSTKTYYLKSRGSYTIGTPQKLGNISARRAR